LKLKIIIVYKGSRAYVFFMRSVVIQKLSAKTINTDSCPDSGTWSGMINCPGYEEVKACVYSAKFIPRVELLEIE